MPKEEKLERRKGEKGSVTLFVLVSMLFFIMVLILSYTNHIDKLNNQKRQIREIEKQYNVDKEIDEIYHEIEDKMPVSIVLYKPTGEVYDIEEWTNQDLTLKIFYPGGIAEEYKYYYLDGVKTKYTEGQKITKNGRIEVRYEGHKAEVIVSRIDKIEPRVRYSPNGGKVYVMPTTGKAMIKTSLMVEDEGGSGLDKKQYAWSTSKEEEPSAWMDIEDEEELRKIDCEPGNYYLWTKVTDYAGNRAERTKISNVFIVNDITVASGQITFIPNTTEWTNEDVTIEIKYGENLTKNRKVVCTGIENVDYMAEGTNGVTIKTNHQTITAEATDIVGNKVTNTITIRNIDKELPMVDLSPNGGTGYTMPTSGNATIKTTLTAADTGGSGLNTLQYAWSTSNTTEPSSWTNFTSGSTISKTDCTATSYYLWTKVTDKAGNRATTTKVSSSFTVGANTLAANQITLTPSTTDWTNGNVTVTASYGANLTANKTLTCSGTNSTDYTVNGTSNVVVKNNNKTVTATATDIAGNKIIKTLAVNNIDKALPTVSLSPNGGTGYTMPSSGNATIKTTLTAADTGGSELDTLQYAWSTSNTTEPSSWTNFTSGSTISKTDCTATNYYLWTKVTDKAGNRATTTKVSSAFTVGANSLAANQITLTPSTTAWTNGDVTVTASYGANLTQSKTLTCSGTNSTDYTVNGTANVVVKTNGKTVTATATDIAGNKITKTLAVNNIDKALPTVSLSPNGGNKYTMPTSGNATIKTTLSAADTGGSGLNTLQYAWSTSNTTEPSSWTNFTSGNTVSKTDCTATSYYLWTKVTDKAGNRATTTKVSSAFTVGANTLAANQITLTPSTTAWTNGNVTVTASYGANLTQSKTLTCSGTNSTDYTVNGTSNVVVKTNGKTVTATATDIVGNKITKTLAVNNIDKALPTVSLSPNGGNKYTMPTSGNATIKTTLTAADTGGSGLNTLQYAWSTSNTTEPSSWTNFTSGSTISKTDCTATSYYLWTKVTDKAGNRATTTKVSSAFTVGANSLAANQITLTPSTTAWTNGNVTVTASYGANLTQSKTLTCSGTNSTDYTVNGTSNVVVKTNGKTVTATATDIAGNKITKTLTVNNIDKALPTVSLSPNGGNKYTMPTSGNATIKTTLTAADTGGSGLNTLQYAWSTSNTTEPSSWTNFTSGNTVSKTDCMAGNYYLWTKVTDKAGNRANSIKVSSAFTVGANTLAANQIILTPSTTNWTNGNVTVTASYGVNLTQSKTLTCSGTNSTDYTVNGTSNVVVKNNSKTVTATATDLVGNKITKTLTVSNIDKVLPTVTLSTNGGTFYTGQSTNKATISTKLTAADTGGSGLNTLQYAWSTSNTTEPSSWANFTSGSTVSKADCTATNYYLWTKVTDKAGNRASTIKVSSAFSVYSLTIIGPSKTEYESSEAVNYSGMKIKKYNSIQGEQFINAGSYVSKLSTNEDASNVYRHTITVKYKNYTWNLYTYKKAWYQNNNQRYWYYWENRQKVVGDRDDIYFLDANGRGCRNTYYFQSDGVMYRGWRQVNGHWLYYFQLFGEPGDADYCYNSEEIIKKGYPGGALLNNLWAKIQNGTSSDYYWYHFDNNGYMQTGWFLENGLWYYLKPAGFSGWRGPTGSMLENTSATIDGKVYNFNSSGVCTNP